MWLLPPPSIVGLDDKNELPPVSVIGLSSLPICTDCLKVESPLSISKPPVISKLPVKVWVSAVVSPNIFDPSVNTIEEVTIEEVILVTFKLVASIVPKVTLSEELNWAELDITPAALITLVTAASV